MKTLTFRTRMSPPSRRPMAPPLVPSPKPVRNARAKKHKPLKPRDIKWLRSIGVPERMIVDAVLRDAERTIAEINADLAKMKQGR